MGDIIKADFAEGSAEAQDTKTYREQPYNILAEQMLLGVFLTNNEAVNKVSDFLLEEHFYEPVHQRIFAAIHKFIERGVIANPITLKNHFDKDSALSDIGGAEYLVKLAGLATTIINVADYARTIYDLSVRRKLIAVGEEIVNDAFDVEIERTAKEQIEKAEQELFILASEGHDGSTGFQHIKSPLIDAIHRAELAFKHRERVSGISTGFVDLDKLLGGFQNSDLLILAGRPSMGKTALGINLAYQSCKAMYEHHMATKEERGDDNLPPPAVGVFSLEMSSEQLAARMLSMVSEVDSSKMRSGHISEDDFGKIVTANKYMNQLPFFIDDTPSLSISALRTRARRLKRRHNLGLILVDYLQLLRGASKQSESNRVLEISEITQGLKAVAKELNIPVIALSQLSRAVEQREDKRPLLSDLRESGSIEQDADIVMFIYRDDYYLMRKQPREGTPEYETWQAEVSKAFNVAEVIIAKQRNGPIGNVRLHYESNLTKFSNLAENDRFPEYHQ
jgi:replicative DNA helicase